MNQLSTFEHLVNATGQADFPAILHEEKNRIIAEWQHTLYADDNGLKQRIQLYQNKLLFLLATITNQFPPELFTTEQSDHQLVQLSFTLYDLLLYLEENYLAYLDLSYNISRLHLLTAREELARETLLLNRILPGTDVMNIVHSSIKETLRSDHVTFRQLYYTRELSKCLRNLQPDSLPEDVDALLLYMNFNDSMYLKYKLQLLSVEINSHPTTHQQLTQTKWLLKMNNQQQEQYGYAYNIDQLSLKDQISDWLMHESEFLEYKIKIDETMPSQEVARWHNFKVKVDLSVNELAFLLRLMIEHGLILNNNKSEVAEFFARYFATNNQPAISADSLRRKMYDYSAASIETVKQLLLDLFHTSKRINAD
ncbi:hypothetical protein SIO70_20220 [Chitinophaga sancti]|uniref:hypothetical protein n=1 Tax=Chitinophaga sancti TaxID=1004 RepID=UPI002A7536D8|nr:hypothetical protein [Chitinophaga sancti]WPQ60681.1 hypothetical protein SIO70_20220 [Chitinophaga sancti]